MNIENPSGNNKTIRISQILKGNVSNEYMAAYDAPGFVRRIRAGVDEQLKKSQFETIGLMSLAYYLKEKGLVKDFLNGTTKDGGLKNVNGDDQWLKAVEKFNIDLSVENLSTIHAHLVGIEKTGNIVDTNGSAKALKLRNNDYNPIFIRQAYEHIVSVKKPEPQRKINLTRIASEEVIKNHALYYEGITEAEKEIIESEAPFWGMESEEKLSPEVIKGVFRAISVINNLPKEVKENLNLSLDGYLLGHLMRVGLLNGLLAQKLNYNSGKILIKPETAAIAGALHDIGKNLPNLEPFIKTDRKLNDAEYESVKLHSPLTYVVLISLREMGNLSGLNDEEFESACNAALWHHIKPDGHQCKSYPKKHPTTGEVLDHNNIPEIGKMTSVSDIFDAIASRRGYNDRGCDSNEIAMSEHQRYKGEQTDAKMVDTFSELGVKIINYAKRRPTIEKMNKTFGGSYKTTLNKPKIE